MKMGGDESQKGAGRSILPAQKITPEPVE